MSDTPILEWVKKYAGLCRIIIHRSKDKKPYDNKSKTNLLIFAYIYRAVMDNLENGKLHITFFSLEMKKEIILAKLLCLYIYETYGKRLSFKELFSRKKDYRLSDEDYELVKSCVPWLEKVDKILNIVDTPVSADTARNIFMEDLKKNGKWEGTGRNVKYIPDDPERTIMCMMDHMALLKYSKSKKEEIDKWSSYIVSLRNRTNATFVMLMQSNRDAASMDRKKQGYKEPMPSDLKDSGGPYEDCDCCLTIYDPIVDNLLTYHDYDIKKLRGRFKAIICLKNRYGAGNMADYCYFDGKVNYWKELPPAKEIYNYDNIFGTKEDQIKIKEDNETNKPLEMNYTL